MERTQQPTPQGEQAQLSLRRHFRVAPEKVWRAWTDPQALRQWFGVGKSGSVTAAEFDLRVGGHYRIAFNGPAGEAHGESHEVSGVYQEVVPLRRLVFSWAFKSTPERVSRVSINLTPTADGTELSFVHDRFFDEQARINHERGWAPMLDQLEGFLHLNPQGA